MPESRTSEAEPRARRPGATHRTPVLCAGERRGRDGRTHSSTHPQNIGICRQIGKFGERIRAGWQATLESSNSGNLSLGNLSLSPPLDPNSPAR